jgi:hypothetical protein
MSLGSRYKGKFATLHPMYRGLYATIDKNLLSWSGVSGQVIGSGIATLGKTFSKWYWEITSPSTAIGGANMFGAVCNIPTPYNNSTRLGTIPTGSGLSASIGVQTTGWTFYKSWPTPTTIGTGTAFNGGDIWGVCMDLDNYNFYIFKNGVRVAGTVSSMQSGTWYPAITSYGQSGTFSINFGATGFAYPSSIPAGFHPGVFDVKSSRLKVQNSGILSDDRLTYDTNNGTDYCVGIIGKKSGKWYWEVTPVDGSVSFVIGVVNSVISDSYIGSTAALLASSNAWIWQVWGSSFKRNGLTINTYGTPIVVNDCIGVALDMDSGQITMYLNGVSQGVMFSGLTGSIYPISSGYAPSSAGTTPKYTFNFGDTPFNYTPPTGYHPGLYD